MNNYKLVIAVVILLGTLQPLPVFAEKPINYFSMSLEELLSVSIASKKDEDLLEAPSVISIITHQQISHFGARNLRDVLDRYVNMQVVGSNLYPHNRLAIRGITQTHTDNKVLLLLNGHVIRDANQGGINTDIYNLFPVDWIKRIEIIRGPGSTLYGTNAFSGVVNIITNDGKINTDSLAVSIGSNSTFSSSAKVYFQQQDFDLDIAINTQNTDGETFNNINGEFGTSGSFPTDKKASQILIISHYKDFDLNLFVVDGEQGNVKSLFVFPSSYLKTQRRHIDLGYHLNLDNDWKAKANFTYNYHQVAFEISNTRATRTDSQDYLFEISLNGKFTDQLDFITGFTFESLKGTIGNQAISPTPFDTYRKGLYTQLNWWINEKNKLVMGAQYNKAEFSDSDISPRFSFIHNIDKHWTSKLLFSEAFRSPFATDLFLNSPSLQGNPDLKPEIIKTYELQFIYLSNDSYFSATAYRSNHFDLHQREVINDVPTFVNKGEVNYDGLEFEFNHHLSSNTQLISNASYQRNSDENGLQQVTFNPQIMIKIGIVYDFNNGITSSLHNSYFSEPTQLNDLGFSPTAINTKASSYHLLTSNTSIQLGTLVNDTNWSNITISLYVDNILDETIYFPSFNRKDVSSLPFHNGRSFLLTVKYEF